MWVPRLGLIARQLGLVVELLRTQLVGPHPGRVHHVRGAYHELPSPLPIQRPHALSATVAFEQADGRHAVGAHRPEALGLAEHGQHQAHVVGLAVVEEVAAGRLARGERGQQLQHLLAGDHAVALGAPARAPPPADPSPRRPRAGVLARPTSRRTG